MPTHYAGTPRERRALDAWITLLRASDAVGRFLTEGLAGGPLTHAQLAVLEALHHRGSMCQADLGRKLLRSGANVTELVDALEARGWVRRERDPADRRRSALHLTDEGQAVIAATFPSHAARVADAFGSLTAEEQRELARLCKKLGLGLSQVRSPTTPEESP